MPVAKLRRIKESSARIEELSRKPQVSKFSRAPAKLGELTTACYEKACEITEKGKTPERSRELEELLFNLLKQAICEDWEASNPLSGPGEDIRKYRFLVDRMVKDSVRLLGEEKVFARILGLSEKKVRKRLDILEIQYPSDLRSACTMLMLIKWGNPEDREAIKASEYAGVVLKKLFNAEFKTSMQAREHLAKATELMVRITEKNE